MNDTTDTDDIPSNPSRETPLAALVRARLNRRQAMGTLGAAAAVAALPGAGLANGRAASRTAPTTGTLGFTEIHNRPTTGHRVAPGYRADVLVRWGDPVLADAPPFEPGAADPRAQARQFGYNNDFMGFLPLPRGSRSSDRGLLCVSHEYTTAHLMWPGVTSRRRLTEAQTRCEIMAHGHSVVEVQRRGNTWQRVDRSTYNRRLTGETPMRLSGPAAGHERLRSSADPSGRRVLGTLNNCAGGVTPWGTVLIAEENFHGYFSGDPGKAGAEVGNHARMGIQNRPSYHWARFDERFDVERDPREPNRFGWIVEFDPYDPFSIPTKRTALGRFKHEGAETVINRDGRVVVYSGDDQANEYIYKFVTDGRFDPDNTAANRNLLDHGTLFVARLHENGAVDWLPLQFGTGPLTPDNGFHSQAEVLIETRRAADLLGATPMDRPEDVQTNPRTGRVYAALTNNYGRKPDQVDAANPRAPNRHGHILEILHPGAEREFDSAGAAQGGVDHAALTARWEVFLLAGNPDEPADGARYHDGVTEHGWLSSPDNFAFDPKGRMWIATDQGSNQLRNGVSDGMRACDTTGEGRALTRNFFACPIGAEMCGPCFTPDGTTLFVAVQHPGDGNHPDRDGGEPRRSTFDDPCTRWPDDRAGVPPRPSVVAITRNDGGAIGD